MLRDLQQEKSYAECRKFCEQVAKDMQGKPYWTLKAPRVGRSKHQAIAAAPRTFVIRFFSI
eukprot:9133198-Pyramimonas_sp.AAC.1